MKLAQLHMLFELYVPSIAWHPSVGTSEWWPAHELGHFLVATRAECRMPMFGLLSFRDRFGRSGAGAEVTRFDRYIRVRELAAMWISRRLLTAVGREDLADEEIEHTDELTLDAEPELRISYRVLLRHRGVLRVPRSFRSLHTLLEKRKS